MNPSMSLKLVISLLIFLVDITQGACPTGWKIWGNYCYHFHDITYATSGMNWGDARLACKRYGGDLLIIRNNTEFNYIVATQTPAQKLQHYWIGLTDEAHEGQWKWVDGTALATTGSHWRTANGEPNNWNGNENCAETTFDGLWNDNGCFREFAFICKKHKDAKIPPAPTLPPIDPSSTKDCKRTVLGTAYRGSKNTTKTGLNCQRWDSQSPQKHPANKPENHPKAGLVENYCRNPDLEPYGPWCYTTSPSRRWEFCDIKLCPSGPVSCEAGWTGFNGSCYRFMKSPETWSEARTDCQARGGDMAIINSAEEQVFIANQAKQDRQGYWIGLTDKYTEGTFYWVDGTKLNDSIAYWNTNEPSNAFGGEDCVELYSTYSLGKWNDNKCTAKRYYVCEKISGNTMCPEDWVSHNDTCYQINAHPEQKKTWLEAQAACRAFQGADLVSIHNAIVRATLTQEMYKVFTKVGYFWIGLSDRDKEGEFTWSDRSKTDYTNWGSNIPNNTDNLDCVKSELSTVKGLWSLAPCNSTAERNFYVCGRKREYNRCHSPLGMENFGIPDSQITASSRKSYTTPPSSGRRNAVKAFGLDGAWCAATNDNNQWLRIDLGEYYSVGFIGLQGHPAAVSYVKSFYLKYSPDGKRWSTYGYQPPSMYEILPGNSNEDRLNGASAALSVPIKARFIEIHPLTWTNAICMRVEVYGCPAVVDSNSCGKGWVNNTALNTCYKFSMTRLPWAAARANCLLEDGDLLSIGNKAELDVIKMESRRYRGKTFSFWSGLNDRDFRNVFKWSDGSRVSSIPWYSGNPTDRYFNRRNCAAIRTYYTNFYNAYCSAKLPYICKRKLKTKNDPKDKYTGNWISKTDYYWPLDDVSDGEIIGTLAGNISGTFTPVSSNVSRRYLSFDGRSSFLKIPGFSLTCVSDPSLCINGVSFSFLTYIESTTATSNTGRLYLLDILGTDQTDSVGSFVYFENRHLGVYLRSQHHMWGSLFSIPFDNWVHVAFTWSEQYGLNIYVNGVKTVTDNSDRRTGSSIKRDRVSDLYIGRSASLSVFAKFKMMSLAIWQRPLSADEVKDVYLAELGKCKIGWIGFGQYCYQFNTLSVRWSTAKLKCESRGGYLATVSTSIQQAFMGLKVGPDGARRDMFIGLNARRAYSTGYFQWADGSPFIYANWKPNAPSISWRREDVTIMQSSFYGAWDDISYYYARGFVCQRKKDIFVSESQAQNSSTVVVIRQYSSETLGCPMGTNLNISSALWGKLPSCPMKDVLSNARSRCSRDKYSCRLVASTSYYGSHCTIRKVLQANYSCIPEKNESLSTAGCSPYWSSTTNNGNCYKLYQLKKNWADARKYCQQQGAELVSIHSRPEEMYLTTLLINSFDLLNIWTGFNDLKVRGMYSWSDKSPVTYTNWFNGQPDDASRRGSCVKTSLQRGYRDMLSWSDDDCKSKNAFICKKLKTTATTAAPKTTVAVQNVSCLAGWFNYGSNCYQVLAGNTSWTSARDACKLQKAVLASIHSLQENEAVFNFLVIASLDSAWIGLQDKGIFRGQRWTDTTPVDFVRWDSGQPDSNLGQQSCTVMSSNGYWRDTNCLLSRSYICKAAIGKASVVPTTKRLTPPNTPSTNLKYCPVGWVLSSATGNCYMFSNSSYVATWFIARSFCQSKGGQLSSIESAAEKDFLAPFILNFRGREAWIGLSDLGVESGWEWVDKKPVNYKNWAIGAPNDWGGMEDCVVMQNGGQWNDVYCGDKKAFICKRQNKTVPVSSTVTPTAGPDKGFCESGWAHYLGKCYQFNSNDKLPWHGARNACRSQMTDGKKSGDLASIHSNYENAFIFSQLKGVTTQMYIGLNDLQYERKFRWSDQSAVTYTNWYTRQPDNYRNIEDCVEMWPFSVHKGKWNDVECTGEQGYICQKDASATKPLPTTTDKPGIVCPEGYYLYAQNCYSFKKQPKTWDDARAACKSENTRSELVSLHNNYDAAYVFSRSFEFTNKIWIGLHRPANETKFRWSNNHPYDYRSWYSYARRRYTNLRSCAYSEYSKYHTGYWRDSNCTRKLPYVCKISNADEEIKPEHPGNCPTGWLKYDKHCYMIKNSYYGTKKWGAAKQICQSFGADLASVHSEAEQIFLYERLTKGSKNVWIGLNDRRIEKHMVWSDGTPYDYKNWNAKEPNDNKGYENCAEMVYLSGKWNDVSCSTYQGYICKKELGCDEQFGVKNSSIIKDSQITASSVYQNYFAQYGRLNTRGKAWCADALDAKQYIQVDLMIKKRVNRILTQGFGSRYVLSFYLLYSDDGTTWQTYIVEGRKAILAGNSNSYSTNGVPLDPPVSARFIRINPLTWKNRICLRFDLAGCGYVCNTPLGLESRTIQNGDITASSDVTTHNAYDARLRNPRGQAWCAKTQDDKQWLQIKLSNKPVKISQVATQGTSFNGKNYLVSAYRIAYSDDAKTWTDYKTYLGELRIFSGNTYPDSAVFHTLSKPVTGKYIRFYPLRWSDKICMRVEVYGCAYECDKPLGIATGKVPDKALTASSSMKGHLPSQARLNGGSFNVGAWCSSSIDQQQYIELDLGADTRITAIATQGFEGDISKYVTDYRVQFSFDAKFWNTYEVSGVIKTFTGNSDGRSVKTNKLSVPMHSRYIRINPRHWKQGICMKIELYGCALAPVVYPTDAPAPKKRVFKGSMRLTEEKYVDAYKNKRSDEFLKMANRIETAITKVYIENYAFKEGFESVQVVELKPGSVVASFIVIYLTDDSNATSPLKQAVAKGKLGDFVVDKDSLKIADVNDKPKSDKSKTTTIVRKEGLSTGGKVALVVIFMLLIVAIVVAGVIYYYKKRRGSGQFSHKSFDNVTYDGQGVHSLPSEG